MKYMTFIYLFLCLSLIAQDVVEEVEEIADNIGPEEASKIFTETKLQYHDINKIIQAGAKLEQVRASQGEDACKEMVKPYQELYEGYRQRMEGRSHRIYYFINAATHKAQNCLSCDSDGFNNDCVLLDRALDIAKSAFGERAGDRIYDTKKYPNNGMKMPVDFVAGGNQNRVVSTRRSSVQNEKKKTSKKRVQPEIKATRIENLNTLNKKSDELFFDQYIDSTASITKEKEKDLFRIISIRYLMNLKKLK